MCQSKMDLALEWESWNKRDERTVYNHTPIPKETQKQTQNTVLNKGKFLIGCKEPHQTPKELAFCGITP